MSSNCKTPTEQEKAPVKTKTNDVSNRKNKMGCCTPKCKKWTAFSVASAFLVLGIVMVTCWGLIFQAILRGQLNVASEDTTLFKMWKETPIPMYMEFYLFNWTNSEEVIKSGWTIKPLVEECGPYTYSEHHYREQITFNHNHTITYKTKRIWKYLPEKSNGSLSDNITTINAIVASMANMIRKKHIIIDLAIDFILNEKRASLTVTKNVSQWLFDGYDDPLLDLVHKLNITAFHVPFKKFGWFVERNGSVDYDGSWTMYDGTSDLHQLGRFQLWNGHDHTVEYDSYCGMVNGTSGELWYPPQDDWSVDVFSPDTCSTLTLKRVKENDILHGVEGHKFIGTERIFDNGTKYPEMACFSPGEASPSGVRNVSQCKFGAPAFISFPHFYLADPSYREGFDDRSFKVNKTIHELYMSVEPETGIPLRVQASMQLNLKLYRIPHVSLLKNVSELYFPLLWFRQTAVLDEDLANTAKMLLVMPSVGHYTGIGLLAVGGLLIAIAIWVTYRDGWRGSGDVEKLLPDNAINDSTSSSTGQQ